MSDEATLQASGARIELAGRPLLSRLTVTTGAERVALLGDWSALFHLLSGEATLSAGELRICGAAVPRGVADGTLGLMRRDPVLPASFSAEQLLRVSAELAGTPRKSAAKLAFEALERLGLGALGSRRLAHLQLGERRALLVAHAALTAPRVLCLEQPLSGLDTHAEQMVLAVIERATQGRRLLVALGAPDLGAGSRALAESCSARLRLAAGVVLDDDAGPPARTRVAVTVSRNHATFEAALASRGLSAHTSHEAGLLGALTSQVAGPCFRFLIELPDGKSAPVLDAALESDAGLLELTPLG